MSAVTTPAATAATDSADRPILQVIDLRAAYGRIEVLRGVTFDVPRGSVVALLGPNGAGKTTTLNVISGQMAPTAGQILAEGILINGARPDRLVRAGICTIVEGRGVFPNLSVEENLKLCSYGGRTSFDQIRDIAYAQFPRLGERRGQLAGRLSGGEQQMLAMARALSTDPGLLMVDELSMGLAPLIVEELYEVVRSLADSGISVLVVEQFAHTALAVADRGVVMTNGKVLAAGRPEEISDAIDEAYLGS
jgi:branched-chain amino acid transport system ATP-binding protein